MVEQLLGNHRSNADKILRNEIDLVMELKPQGDRRGRVETEKHSHTGETEMNDCPSVTVTEEVDTGQVCECEMLATPACSHTFHQAQTCFPVQETVF